MDTKYIFVTGGVMSGVGKGISTASIACLLKSRGYSVSVIKIDPYVNVDAGTMNPTEHGEVFVTEDGDETDQDIGNYERFLDKNILSDNYMTTGRVYLSVIQRERNLEYEGRCVEVVPEVPLEVVRRIKHAAKLDNCDIMLIEIGGTVGEYQNMLFLEAARMMKLREPESVAFVLVSYLPVPGSIGEMKTKPTQYAIRSMNSAGIQPNFVIARAHELLDQARKRKIAHVTGIDESCVVGAPDIDSIYKIPQVFAKEELDVQLLKFFKLDPRQPDLKEWDQLAQKIDQLNRPVKIGIVGKYFQSGEYTLKDAYISVIEAIKHASWANNCQPQIDWINAESYEAEPEKLAELNQYDGIIIPGGYGSRGVEGKIRAIEYARKNNIPYLGLCYGMQMAVVEFARNVAGLAGAHTEEIDPQSSYPVIHIMHDQKDRLKNGDYGGTMRLGAYACLLENGSVAQAAYQSMNILERHRHRYEVNNEYRHLLTEKGLRISGTSPDGKLVEIIELPKEVHPFFVGVQFHPEFKSRPLVPHPLFKAFIQACTKKHPA